MGFVKIVFFSLYITFAFADDANEQNEIFTPVELTANVANEYALYAMISSNVYHKADRVKFPVEKLGWITVDTVEIDKSGLAYDIFEHQYSNNVIFAFRGTDDKKDYTKANVAIAPFNIQYQEATEHFKSYLDTHKDKNITLTGHSLGGALALSMSVNYGIDAIVFNSSPRIFEEVDETYAPAKRVMIYQDGEILTSVRKIWKKKFSTIVPLQNTYKASFDFGGTDVSKISKISLKHRADYLALGLLELGATVDTKLARIVDMTRFMLN
ncbi:YqiA/YcfP family alpha/beta fold hydrolase [Sulfuricurvum sp.]|uniref:YqiA/YcfP family alpha/beta fold hydrolase n=1 Tax=Sulfuricurvum sp. TaxID=2025608 RepID=UPI003BB492C9